MTQGIDLIFSIAVLILSVVIHEVSHGYVAAMLGDPTAKLSGRLTLNPLKHVDPIGSVLVPIVTSIAGFPFGWAKPVPYNPYNLRGGKWGPALVAVAGPVSNLLLAAIFAMILRFNPLGLALISTTGITPLGAALISIVIVNVFLGIFNLFPIAPLDGSKLLFALLPYHLRYIEAFMEANQLTLILLFVFFGGRLVQSIASFFITLLLGVQIL